RCLGNPLEGFLEQYIKPSIPYFPVIIFTVSPPPSTTVRKSHRCWKPSVTSRSQPRVTTRNRAQPVAIPVPSSDAQDHRTKARRLY
ncbi:Unknown protein, partial [Striga hermonthica]